MIKTNFIVNYLYKNKEITGKRKYSSNIIKIIAEIRIPVPNRNKKFVLISAKI